MAAALFDAAEAHLQQASGVGLEARLRKCAGDFRRDHQLALGLAMTVVIKPPTLVPPTV